MAVSQRLTISAKVVDKETKEPLVFASVGIKDRSIGTITNLQGEFDFHFPAEYRNDVLAISILGYKNFEAPVWTLLDKRDMVIELEKTTFVLEEVVVKDSLSGGEVLRIALSRIEQNYPSEPYVMDGFYRDLKKVDNTYISLLEAATKIYDENYRAPRNYKKLRERVALMEVRRSIGYGNKFTSYFEQSNLLEELLLQNSVKYRHFPEDDIFYDSLMKRDHDSFFNGHDIFVIGYHGEYELTLYVDKTNFGIIHMEYSNNPNDRVKKNGMIGVYDYFKRTLDFRMFNGKLYPNYIKMDSRITWEDMKSKEVKLVTELFQELLINDIDVQPEERIGITEKMKSYGLQYQDLPYNKDFWENYNVIKESPLDKKIIADLEKQGPLEKQFQDNR
ncbi:MAG TPA: carboxypeptidase-like regulatory domain-containing protein [Cyclobacteriaceae bacterium]|nr:carboxypeptidase-like regulatory domain-containing protein [Cyclobacteriaceae bacterium]